MLSFILFLNKYSNIFRSFLFKKEKFQILKNSYNVEYHLKRKTIEFKNFNSRINN